MKNLFGRVFGGGDKEVMLKQREEKATSGKIVETLEEEEMSKKLKQRAYSEAEVELGTNAQAKAEVGKLGSNDFDYISKVEKLVENKLKDPEWVNRTKDNIKNQYVSKKNNDDKTIGTNKDILMSHAHRIDEDNKKIEKLKGELLA